MPAYEPPRHILGVDFSGAVDARNKIWVCAGAAAPSQLVIHRCDPVRRLGPVDRSPESACETLVAHILAAPAPLAAGFDFPFGIQSLLLPACVSDWVGFLAWFASAFDGAERFRAACRDRMRGGEPKRDTDREAGTPWAPHNLRLYKQTFHGLRHVLHPLVTHHGCRALPNQWPPEGERWLLETCPASALRPWGRIPYKGRTDAHRTARAAILERLVRNQVVVPDRTLREAVLDNAGGDALDAILCAWVTWRAVQSPVTLLQGVREVHRLEGFVYT